MNIQDDAFDPFDDEPDVLIVTGLQKAIDDGTLTSEQAARLGRVEK